MHRLQRGVVRFQKQLQQIVGSRPTASQASDQAAAGRVPRGDITIEVTGTTADYPSLTTDESYHLDIDSSGIRISAASGYGALHALQTLLQLARFDDGRLKWPFVQVSDNPRFPWRGLLQDTVRHWMPVEVIERQLDAMAAVKLNVLHFHLSDDESFRVESKSHPQLHEKGSDGDYYSQEEIRHLVEYAADRGIRVVPEFDLPGHSRSWQIAYPQLSSRPGKDYDLYAKDQLFSDGLDPTREENYELIGGITREMSALFPDDYFHMGGDEVNYDAWLSNHDITGFMAEKGFNQPQDLQAYFIRRYYDMIRALDKTAMGWEEILHPNMPEDAVLHIWLSRQFPKEAARHPILVSQGYYLDLMQTAYAHHQKDPVDIAIEGLSPEEKIRVEQQYLGGEAASWAEHINQYSVDMRNWPRAAAIAERLWSPRDITDAMTQQQLYPRLFALSDRLEAIGLTHRSHTSRAMKTLAGPDGNSEALQVLATITEPASEHNNSEYGMILAYLTGITWFVDFPTASYAVERFLEHIPPESETAWWFNHRVELFLAGELPADGLGTLRQQLKLWSENHSAAQATIASSDILLNDGVDLVSRSASELAAFGLDALNALAAQAPLDKNKLEAGRKIVGTLDYLDHSTETETEYFKSNLFKPRGFRLHVVPIQRGIKQLLTAVETL